MKKLILLICAAFLFASCSSLSERDIYESENGYSFQSSSSQIDALRGASEKRDVEQMEFSRNIIRKAGEPYVEYSLPPDPVPTRYTGRVKIYIWEKGKFTALREIESNSGTTKWQGPNPPTGFYGWRKATEIVISSLSPENIERLAKEGIIL